MFELQQGQEVHAGLLNDRNDFCKYTQYFLESCHSLCCSIFYVFFTDGLYLHGQLQVKAELCDLIQFSLFMKGPVCNQGCFNLL